jgi:hypothetical protein
MWRRIKKKGEKHMPLFTIMHIYEVPAKNQYEATDELMTAWKHNFDKVFLKKVLVKDTEPKHPQEKVNVFAPKKPGKWGTIFKRHSTGNWWVLAACQNRTVGSRGKHSPKGGELCMAKYLVQVAIPTIYVIDARSPLCALDKAVKRFQTEHNTQLEPEGQWAELTGSDTDPEWRITDWGELPL